MSEKRKLKTNYVRVTINYHYYHYLLKCEDTLNELEKDIDNFDVFKEFSFPLMKRWEEEQVKSSIDYEWRKAIKEPFLNKLKELKGSDK